MKNLKVLCPEFKRVSACETGRYCELLAITAFAGKGIPVALPFGQQAGWDFLDSTRQLLPSTYSPQCASVRPQNPHARTRLKSIVRDVIGV